MPEPRAEGDMSDSGAVRIPKDLAKRKELMEFAGLTAEERHAIDLWCAEQARENDRRQRRGWEQHANEPMA